MATQAPPPLPPIPQKKSKAALTTGSAYNAFINAHPTMRAYSDAIWTWAHTYGVDPVVMAALYWRESFAAAKASGQDPASIVSPAGAVGIGQIMPLHVGERTPWGHIVSQTDLLNPRFNIRWSSWYFSQQVQKYGSVDAAYNKGYNPGYTGAPLSSLLPKNYVPRGGGETIPEKGQTTAQQSAATKTATAQLTDRWVILGKNGKISFVRVNDINKPPKNVLEWGNIPVSEAGTVPGSQGFRQVWGSYSDVFFAYTGRAASGKEIAGILKSGITSYGLENKLAAKPGFVNSPTYKAHAPGIVEYARAYYGENWKPDTKMVAKAIAQNWDQATLDAHLKARPEYLKGPKFLNDATQLQNVYSQVIGTPDAKAITLAKEAALQGWSQDQFASYLRSQPQYAHSNEFQQKLLQIMAAVGQVTGQVPTLAAGGVGGLSPGEPSSGLTAPNSTRIPGTGTVTAPNTLTPELGGTAFGTI